MPEAQQLISEFEKLRSERFTLDNHCTEIAERMWPAHKDLFSEEGGLHEQGEKVNQEIYDSTAMVALGRFAAILDSLLTPRNAFWHQIKPDDATLARNKQVRDYFARVNTILFEQRYAPKANFAAQNQLQYKSLGSYGTGAMFVDDIFGEKGVRYKNVHLSELYIQENHQGVPDRICRRFYMTARQALQQFGEELPDTIKSQAEVNPNRRYKFLHWVVPNMEQDPLAKDFRGMPFSSYYVSIEGRKIVQTGGYETFPYAVSRYEQENNSAYGRSPAMDVLPSVKTLNEQKKTMLKQGHLSVDPVILAHDDGALDLYDATPGSMVPGGVNKDGRPLIQPMPHGRVDIGKDYMEEERALVNDTFLVTLFQILVENPQMTATEVLERTREKGILLAPTVGRQQSEYLGPMIERELDILARQGVLPPQPRMLQEAKGEFKIIYDSPITRTQKAEWASGAMRTVDQALAISTQIQDPSLLFYFNWDIIIPQVADINGTPSTWLNGAEIVARKKQALAEAQQRQQAIEAAPAAAGLAKAAQ